MKSLKIVVTVMFAVIISGIFATPINVNAEQPIRVIVNGVQVQFTDQHPVAIDGRTLVPVRDVFETMGFNVEWMSMSLEGGGTGGMVFISNATHTISLSIDVSEFSVNGYRYWLDVPAQLIGGRTLIPLRLPLERVGYNVDWDGANRTVVITSQ